MATRMNNTGVSIIEAYNNVVAQIRKAKTVDEIRTVSGVAKDFISTYKTVDADMVNEVYVKLQDRLNELLTENDFVYERALKKVDEIKNRAYDFKGEKDDTQQVQAKALQLMASMPKNANNTNINKATTLLTESINSGVIGSKAVIELLKYPMFANLVSEPIREKAFEGSKSQAQKAFESANATESRDAEQALANVYMQGYHIRTIIKQVEAFKKPRAWKSEDTE